MNRIADPCQDPEPDPAGPLHHDQDHEPGELQQADQEAEDGTDVGAAAGTGRQSRAEPGQEAADEIAGRASTTPSQNLPLLDIPPEGGCAGGWPYGDP